MPFIEDFPPTPSWVFPIIAKLDLMLATVLAFSIIRVMIYPIYGREMFSLESF
jgi:hypothetical protein